MFLHFPYYAIIVFGKRKVLCNLKFDRILEWLNPKSKNHMNISESLNRNGTLKKEMNN